MPTISWIPLSEPQQTELSGYVMEPGWRILQQASLPSCYSSGLLPKLDSGVLIASPTSAGGIYLVINNYRVDFKSRLIDQQPFAIISHTTGMGSVACFVNHGGWEGRSFAPPQDFWIRVNESGVGNYFYSVLPPGKLSGSLDELPRGDLNAFEYITRRFRSDRPEWL